MAGCLCFLYGRLITRLERSPGEASVEGPPVVRRGCCKCRFPKHSEPSWLSHFRGRPPLPPGRLPTAARQEFSSSFSLTVVGVCRRQEFTRLLRLVACLREPVFSFRLFFVRIPEVLSWLLGARETFLLPCVCRKLCTTAFMLSLMKFNVVSRA